MSVAREDVRHALRDIHDPCSVASGVALGLDEMGLIKDIDVDPDGNVEVSIRLTSPTCVMVGFFTDEIVRAATRVDGVQSVSVVFDAGLDWEPSLMSAEVRAKRARRFSHQRRRATTNEHS